MWQNDWKTSINTHVSGERENSLPRVKTAAVKRPGKWRETYDHVVLPFVFTVNVVLNN